MMKKTSIAFTGLLLVTLAAQTGFALPVETPKSVSATGVFEDALRQMWEASEAEPGRPLPLPSHSPLPP